MLDKQTTRPRNDDLAAKEYTIAQLAAQFGVSYRTLRFYEQKGLLHPERDGPRRLYSGKDRLRLGIIALAKRLGFSLADIRELIESRDVDKTCAHESRTSVASLGLSRDEVEERIVRLTQDRNSLQNAIEELQRAASECLASENAGLESRAMAPARG